ncbi:hypothetical protein C8R43DRAFT_954604 [Mycena crocata]|nr:hypothetical protein C8R43DRAFT_954604 [Mycena crocata]
MISGSSIIASHTPWEMNPGAFDNKYAAVPEPSTASITAEFQLVVYKPFIPYGRRNNTDQVDMHTACLFVSIRTSAAAGGEEGAKVVRLVEQGHKGLQVQGHDCGLRTGRDRVSSSWSKNPTAKSEVPTASAEGTSQELDADFRRQEINYNRSKGSPLETHPMFSDSLLSRCPVGCWIRPCDTECTHGGSEHEMGKKLWRDGLPDYSIKQRRHRTAISESTTCFIHLLQGGLCSAIQHVAGDFVCPFKSNQIAIEPQNDQGRNWGSTDGVYHRVVAATRKQELVIDCESNERMAKSTYHPRDFDQ